MAAVLVVAINTAFALALLFHPIFERSLPRARASAIALLCICAGILLLIARATASVLAIRAPAARLAAFEVGHREAIGLMLFSPLLAGAVALDEGGVSETGLVAVCLFTCCSVATLAPQARFGVTESSVLIQPAFSLLVGQLPRSELVSFESAPSAMHELAQAKESRRVAIRTLQDQEFVLHLVGAHARAAAAFEPLTPRTSGQARASELIPSNHPEMQQVIAVINLYALSIILTSGALFTGAITAIALYKLQVLGRHVHLQDWIAVLYRQGGAPLVAAAYLTAIAAGLGFFAWSWRKRAQVKATLGDARYWQLVLSHELRQPPLLRTHGPDRRLSRNHWILLATLAVATCALLLGAALEE